MSALAALALSLAPISAGAAPAYPVPAILAAFDSACSEPGDSVANAAALEKSGWTRLAETARTPLSRAVDAMLHGSYSLDSGTNYGAQFRKRVAGRTLYALLSQTHYGGSMSGTDIECSLFDFEAPRAPSAEELGAWSGGRTPDRDETEPNGERFLSYDANDTEHLRFYVYFLPKRSGEGNAYTGLRISASAYRGER